MKGPKQTPVKMQTTELGAKGMLQNGGDQQEGVTQPVLVDQGDQFSLVGWTGMGEQGKFWLVSPDEDDGEDHYYAKLDDGSLNFGQVHADRLLAGSQAIKLSGQCYSYIIVAIRWESTITHGKKG